MGRGLGTRLRFWYEQGYSNFSIDPATLPPVSRLHLTLKLGQLGVHSVSLVPSIRLPSQIVDMIREYLQMSEDNKEESDELERLASQLTLSETPQQVCE